LLTDRFLSLDHQILFFYQKGSLTMKTLWGYIDRVEGNNVNRIKTI